MVLANRGVAVHTLIAYTNRGGENGLRKLEMRLLAEGVTVSRTADDLARYHAKYMIIDRCEVSIAPKPPSMAVVVRLPRMLPCGLV